MSRRWETIEQRRREVRRLHDKLGLSIRQIAKRVGVSVGTVHADLRATDNVRPRNPHGHLATIQPPPNAAGPGNARRQTHGAYGDKTVAPHRERRHRELLERYPWKRADDLMPLADRLGRIDVITVWEAEHGIVENSRGTPQPATLTKEQWQRRAEKQIAELERERRDRGQQALASGPLSTSERAELEEILDRAAPAPGQRAVPDLVDPSDWPRLVALLARAGVTGESPRVDEFRLDYLAWVAAEGGSSFAGAGVRFGG